MQQSGGPAVATGFELTTVSDSCAVVDIFAITSSRLKLAGFCCGRYSWKLESRLAASACVRLRRPYQSHHAQGVELRA